MGLGMAGKGVTWGGDGERLRAYTGGGGVGILLGGGGKA